MNKKLIILICGILVHFTYTFGLSDASKDFNLVDFYKGQNFITDTTICDTVELYGYRLIFNSIDSSSYFQTLTCMFSGWKDLKEANFIR
ncbi:MAG: hypothetical protein MI922_13295 [Bacteroidales bacterium]|nr:hypothetical protein [Bacteroidales bacterium]